MSSAAAGLPPAAKSSKSVARPNHDAAWPAGFVRPESTEFAALAELAPPGPDRAKRALAILDRTLPFLRRIYFHPELSPELQQVVAKLPPRQSTLIRAAAMYPRSDIPWIELPDGGRQIAVRGAPQGANYRYALASSFEAPQHAEEFSGAFTLRPADESGDGEPASVVGELSSRLMLDDFGGPATIDVVAAECRQVYGDLEPPWDSAPGTFNHHDAAALERFRRDLPNLAGRIDHYLEFSNILDEFQGPDGPWVLFNLEARVRPGALEPFPQLARFYRRLSAHVSGRSTLFDARGRQWLRLSFDRGRIRIVFLIRAGMPAPFDSELAPLGEPIEPAKAANGEFHSETSVHIRSMDLDFGLDDLRFFHHYRREPDALTIDAQLEAAPRVVAPPIVKQVVMMIAAEFMRVLAEGNGGRGLIGTFSSRRSDSGTVRLAGDAAGEFRYSPALSFIASIGDRFAEAHNDAVRIEERRLGEEFFDALVADFNRSRGAILRLDKDGDARQ